MRFTKVTSSKKDHTQFPEFFLQLAAVMGWTMAWAVGLLLVYIHYDNLGDIMHGLGWNASDNAAYESLNKVMWAVCVSWVIFACSTGFGGWYIQLCGSFCPPPVYFSSSSSS